MKYKSNCKYCDKLNCPKNCPNNGTQVLDDPHSIGPNPVSTSVALNLNGGEYTHFYAGMGCAWYVRKNSLTLELEYFFLHSDSHGQYGDDTSDLYRLKAFEENYTYVNKDVINGTV